MRNKAVNKQPRAIKTVCIKICYRIVFILLVVMCYSNIQAQFSIGLNFEPFTVNGNVGYNDGISPYGVSAAAAYQFDSTKSVLFSAGLYAKNLDGKHFAGSNYFLLGKYYFNQKLYALTGLGIYDNEATSSMSGRITNHTITLINVGFGV